MPTDSTGPLVLIPGEINLDVVMSGFETFPTLGREVLVDDLLVTLGSASAITAVGLSKLGVPVRFVGKVGPDAWGTQCLDAMSEAGVDVSGVRRGPELRTGMTVAISSADDRALVTYPGAIADLTADDIPETAWADVRHLHVSSYFLQRGLQATLPRLFRDARARGVTVSLDPGGDPDDRWDGGIRDALAAADLFFPNEVELREISRHTDAVQSLRTLQNGRTATVVKLGPQGCLALDGSQATKVPAPNVAVVDTTGAGDSFNAGFLAAWLRRAALVACMRDGVCCGALATRRLGGTTAQPGVDELAVYRQEQFGEGARA